jgi:hypothetical protein
MPTKTLKEIVLRDFVALALGPVVDRIAVPIYIAQQIEAEDEEESICHIEWPEDGTSPPIMWRIEDWRTSSKREEHKRKLSALDRAIWVRAGELRAALAKRIAAQVGLTADESENMVSAIIRTRNSQAAEFFGTNLAELIEADEALNAYKQSKK